MSRLEESKNIIDKYPNRIPVIVESKEFVLEKHKYLVPKSLTMGGFLHLLKKKIELKPEEAVFLFVNNKYPLINSTMEELYENEKSECGFLFIHLARESVFGSVCPAKKCPHFEKMKECLTVENIEKCPYLKEKTKQCPHYN